MNDSRILLVDVERAPTLGHVWQLYETNVIAVARDWYMLSFSYKWLGDGGVKTCALPDYSLYRVNKENDKALICDLWKLFDQADIIVAHNGDYADIPWSNTRFITHGLKPPSPYKTVDTRKLARRKFRFDSNKLDELGRYLGLGRKLTHTGFDLWKRCMEGDRKAWQMMKRYNEQDLVLLEKVYLILRSWGSHPNVNKDRLEACPKCGSGNVQRRGFSYTPAGARKQRYRCMSCHGWYEGGAKREKKRKG